MEVNEIASSFQSYKQIIDEAKEAIDKGGLAAAAPYGPKIQSTFASIKQMGKLEGVSIPPEKRDEIRTAIEKFQESADAALNAAPLAVSLLGIQSDVDLVKGNLQHVLSQLKDDRGGKVSGTELGGTT